MEEPAVRRVEGEPEPEARPGEGAEDGARLEALAEQIYRLLKKEARLERERLGGRRTW